MFGWVPPSISGFGGFDARGSHWLEFLEVNAALFALQVLFGGVAWLSLAQRDDARVVLLESHLPIDLIRSRMRVSPGNEDSGS